MSQPAMWRPSTEDELRSTIDAGGLEETHFFEVKELLPATPSGRKELARDLAQFSIDGGVLLIGVAEYRDERQSGWSLAPTPLQGLSERIDQIARSTIDPPLTIRVTQFRATVDAGTGYVVVEVPASPAAPHMVDGRYYGRGDKARYQLSDSEVERLHAARRTLHDEAGRLLDEEIARDPYPVELRRHGHLYLGRTAHSCGPRPCSRPHRQRQYATAVAVQRRTTGRTLSTRVGTRPVLRQQLLPPSRRNRLQFPRAHQPPPGH